MDAGASICLINVVCFSVILFYSPVRLSRTPVDAATNTRIGANIRSSRYNKPRDSACSAGTLEDQLKRKKKRRKKKEEAEYDYNDNQSKIDVIPIFCAVTIASILGGPVCLVANLKLGMFAAIGGGIMGYTTGRMFSDHGHVECYTEVQ